jgi:shikimate dehydrogenase
MVHPRTREIEWNLRGLSVTAPHKSSIIAHLDWLEPAAKEMAAVNTVVVKGDELFGYNTDASALLKPVVGKLGSLNASSCAIIGAGATARAALWTMRQERASVTVYARDMAKARSLCEKFGARCRNLDGAQFEAFDLVINATPLGTKGQEQDGTPAVASQLRGARFAYDLVYNPTETRFLREAREAGCKTIGGLPMLVAQATEQFKLWTGCEAPEQLMHDAARQALETSTKHKA